MLCGTDDSPLVALVRSNQRLVEIGEDSAKVRNEYFPKLVAETVRDVQGQFDRCNQCGIPRSLEMPSRKFQLRTMVSASALIIAHSGRSIVHSQNEKMQSLVGSVEVSCNRMLSTQEQSTAGVLAQTAAQVDSLLSRFDESTDAHQKSLVTSVDYIVNNVRAWTDSASVQLVGVLDAGASEETSRRNATDEICALVKTLADIADGSNALALQLNRFESSFSGISKDLQFTIEVLSCTMETQAVATEFAQSSDSLQLALRENRRLGESRYSKLKNVSAQVRTDDHSGVGNGHKPLIDQQEIKS